MKRNKKLKMKIDCNICFGPNGFFFCPTCYFRICQNCMDHQAPHGIPRITCPYCRRNNQLYFELKQSFFDKLIPDNEKSKEESFTINAREVQYIHNVMNSEFIIVNNKKDEEFEEGEILDINELPIKEEEEEEREEEEDNTLAAKIDHVAEISERLLLFLASFKGNLVQKSVIQEKTEQALENIMTTLLSKDNSKKNPKKKQQDKNLGRKRGRGTADMKSSSSRNCRHGKPSSLCNRCGNSNNNLN